MKRILPFAVIAFLPLVFYWKLFHPDPDLRLVFRGDFLNQHYVWKSYALERVKSGELPLWNPHVLGGVPFHANPQVGIFYPPTYLLLPFQRDGELSYVALEAYQLLHQISGGIGMLLFLRCLGVGTMGALFAAIVFMFTGFFTTPGHHAIVATASYLPWLLLATAKSSPPLLAGVLALTILAGHPQIAYYALLFSAAFSIARAGVRSTLMRFLPATVLGIGIAAVQILPTHDMARESVRAELGYDYSTSFGFSPYFLAATVAPRGQIRLPNQDGSAPLHIYAGVSSLLLATIALLLSHEKVRLFFAASAAVALFSAFGKDSLLFDLFYLGLPGFSLFRVPYRLLGVYVFSVAVLAGLGMDTLVNAGRKEKLRLRSVAKSAFAVLVGLGVWAGTLQVRLLSNPGSLEPADVERAIGAAHWAVLLFALNFLLLLLVLWRPRERWALGAILVLTAVDMGAFVKDRSQHPYRTLVRAEERPVHRYLRAQGERARYVTESNLEGYDMLHGTDFAGGHEPLVDARYAELREVADHSANALSLMNVKFLVSRRPPSRYPWCGARFASPLPLLDVSGDVAPARFELAEPVDVQRILFDWSPLGPSGTAVIEVEGQTHSLPENRPLEVDFGEPHTLSGFAVLVEPANPGVRLQDIELDLNPIGLKVDFLELDGIRINLHALPRAYFVVASTVPSEAQMLEGLSCWSVHDGVQVTSDETGRGASGFFRKDAARVVTYAPEMVEIETRSPRAGYAVLLDTLRPGWIAEVDGRETEILRTQHAFRAVAVPEGEHRVRFSYRPRSLRLGGLTSLTSVLLVAAWAGWTRFRPKRA
ncbi:MAG TPA: YfhO family protein [Vicinamibacteria bacterium]|nr:YfhO family protein [Vicinamibacteria bacterium]